MTRAYRRRSPAGMPIGRPIRTIAGVSVVDPAAGEVHPEQTIRIEAGRIVVIEPASSGEPAAGDALDGTGLFAIPGLIDAHVHALGVFVEELPGVLDLAWVARQQTKNLKAFLESGVTTIRDLGRLQPGATADVVLLRGNPLEDVAAVGHVEAVLRDGRLAFRALGA